MNNTVRVPSKFTKIRALRESVAAMADNACRPAHRSNNAKYSFARIEAPLF